jgi:hypothetical protein
VSITTSEDTVTISGVPAAGTINNRLAIFMADQHTALQQQVACVQQAGHGGSADLVIGAHAGGTRKLVSVLFDSAVGSTCLAHPMNLVASFLVDPTSGADVDRQTLFNDNGLRSLAALVLTLPDVGSPQAGPALEQACGSLTADDVLTELTGQISSVRMGIVSDGLMVDFPPYSFGRARPCRAVLKVPLAQLGGILKPEYLPGSSG